MVNTKDIQTCKKCNENKTIDEFTKCKSYKLGYSNECKKCKNIRLKKHREKNPERVKELRKKHYSLEKKRIWKQKNKDFLKIKDKEYREKNKEKIKIHYITVVAPRNKINYNKEEKSIYNKEYGKKNRKILNHKSRERKKNNPLIRMKDVLRCRMGQFLRESNFKKNKSTELMLGLDYEKVKKHIERQFAKGMTWENHGKGSDKWNIDHIIPLASAKNEEELLKLFHYKNLQPLWEIDNNIKKDKIINHIQNYLAI